MTDQNEVVESKSGSEEQPILEGELQTPRGRAKVFSSYKELAHYLLQLVDRPHVQIDTGQDRKTGRVMYQLTVF